MIQDNETFSSIDRADDEEENDGALVWTFIKDIFNWVVPKKTILKELINTQNNIAGDRPDWRRNRKIELKDQNCTSIGFVTRIANRHLTQ